MLRNLINGTKINIDVAREKLFTLYDLEWQDSIGTKPKLRTNVKFKCHISTENYVSQTINKYERSLLAKLRSGMFATGSRNRKIQKQTIISKIM